MNQETVNNTSTININLENKKYNNKGISKKGKVMMFIVLFSTIIIFFDNFIKSMDWFGKLQWQAIIN